MSRLSGSRGIPQLMMERNAKNEKTAFSYRNFVEGLIIVFLRSMFLRAAALADLPATPIIRSALFLFTAALAIFFLRAAVPV